MMLFRLKKYWTILLVALLPSCFNILHGQGLGLPFTKYIGSEAYGAGMQNNAIAQDARGFVYFANNFALLEFDGSEWQSYPVKYGSKLRDLSISDDGKIYIAAQGEFGFFTPDQKGQLVYQSLSTDLAKEYQGFDEVWKVFLGNNKVYFCTTNRIFIYSDDELTEVKNIPNSSSFYFVHNRLYLQSDSNELFYYFNGQLSPLISNEILEQKAIAAILPDEADDLIIICQSGQMFDQDGSYILPSSDHKKFLANTTINTALRLSNGNIAYGTQNNGIYLFQEGGALIKHLNKGKGLNERVVISILEDIQGNLWLGHNNGISLIEFSIPFSYLNEENGLPGTGYDAYSHNGSVFYATNNGLYAAKFDNPYNDLTKIENTDGQNYSIDEIGNKLILGHHKGAFEIQDNKAKSLFDETGTWVFRKPMLSNEIIGGTYFGLALFRLQNGNLKFEKTLPGFNESSRIMEFDAYGDLWMTHGYKGVYRIKLSESSDSILDVQFYEESHGLPSKALVNVFKIGNELLFTTIDGLYQFDYKDNKFKPETLLTQATGIGGRIDFLAADSQTNIYFITQSKVGVLENGIDGAYKMESDIFNKVFPYLNDDLLNISILNSNDVLFGAKEGFIIYDASKRLPEYDNFSTYIRNVSILSANDTTLFSGNFKDENKIVSHQSNNEQQQLEFGNNSIHFRFTANFMNDYDQTLYQHKLEGFDDDWSQWHSNNSQDYTNLHEGEYVFHVRAKNIYNNISKETVYQFIISPPWYRSKLAFSGYAAAIIGSFVMFFLFIDRKYKKSKRSFEIEKQEELDEIDFKLKYLEQETSEEIEKLKSEKLETEIEYKNAELATSTMNLINKNKFISHIKSSVNSISKKSTSNEVIKELEKISKEIDKNISHDDDWKQFALHFNKVHGDFSTRLTSEYENLSAQDLRLCSYLRLNLSTKEIAELLNISVRGVEISRYRLRKKLELERSINLSEFILNY